MARGINSLSWKESKNSRINRSQLIENYSNKLKISTFKLHSVLQFFSFGEKWRRRLILKVYPHLSKTVRNNRNSRAALSQQQWNITLRKNVLNEMLAFESLNSIYFTINQLKLCICLTYTLVIYIKPNMCTHELNTYAYACNPSKTNITY